MRTVTTLAAAVVAVAGCGGGGGDTNEATDGLAGFEAAVDDGASCQELFDVINAADPDVEWRDDANEMLRGVGCYSSSSTRTDQ